MDEILNIMDEPTSTLQHVTEVGDKNVKHFNPTFVILFNKWNSVISRTKVQETR